MKNAVLPLIGDVNVIVRKENTAKAMGSGALEVFATPAMCALMEAAAVKAVAGILDENEDSVGISLNITHDAPTALGKLVTAEAKLEKIEGRKLYFSVKATEGEKIIGKGTHERFVINPEKFMSKLK